MGSAFWSTFGGAIELAAQYGWTLIVALVFLTGGDEDEVSAELQACIDAGYCHPGTTDEDVWH